MEVVAVFEIHMERNMVGSMRPSISSRGLVPMVVSAASAIRWCRKHFSTEMAVMSEPEMREMS